MGLFPSKRARADAVNRKPVFLILPAKERQYGGPLSFSTRLRAYLHACGFEEQESIDSRLDVLIVFVQAPLTVLIKARALGIPILLRLDGLYYPRKAGWFNREYLRVNLRVFLIRLFLCDAVVYQSAYSRSMCDRLIGPTPKPFRIIHNGVPVGPAPGPREPEGIEGLIRFVAIGNFRGQDMLPATFAALDRVHSPRPFTLDIYGRMDAASKKCIDRPYARYRGEAAPDEIIAILSGYDALIFTQLCPSCPNAVIEGVAAHLPVIAFDSGSVRELLKFNGELIASAGNRFFQGVQDFDPEALARCIETFLAEPERFRRESARHARDFAIEERLSEYRNILLRLIGKGPVDVAVPADVRGEGVLPEQA